MNYRSLLVAVDSRLKSLCAVGNQKCCGGVSSAVVSRNNFSSMSFRVKQSLSIEGTFGRGRKMLTNRAL